MAGLMELSGALTKAELLRKALGLLDLVLSTVADGGTVSINHPDGTTERVRFL
jgi:hypothetical protein